MKSATLELILKANGKKTGDELIHDMELERKRLINERNEQIISAKVNGTFRNSKERRKLRLVMENGAKQ